MKLNRCSVCQKAHQLPSIILRCKGCGGVFCYRNVRKQNAQDMSHPVGSRKECGPVVDLPSYYGARAA